MPPMPKILVSLTPEHIAWLRKESHEKHTSVNDILRRNITQWMPGNPTEKGLYEPFNTKGPLYTGVIRGKGLYDGSRGIFDLLIKLAEAESWLNDLAREGVLVVGEVQDDYVTLVTDRLKVAKRRKFVRVVVETERDAIAATLRRQYAGRLEMSVPESEQ